MIIYLFVATFLTFFSHANTGLCEASTYNSCRDSYTKQISPRKVKKAIRRYENREEVLLDLDNTFERLNGRDQDKTFIAALLTIPSIREDLEKCEKRAQSTEYCRKKYISDMVYLAFSRGHMDATAAFIVLNRFKSEKKRRYGSSIKSYAAKVKNLERNFAAINGEDESYGISPLSQKEYLQKFGPLKKLTPRQRLLLKYNYLQIKMMGKVLEKFNERVLSMKAGVYFDYDGDGTPDELIDIDPAEKYRMSVKLLKLELEKHSHKGEIFFENKPTMIDLLAAANELGLIRSEHLKEMMSLPHLIEEETPVWKKALGISWNIGRSLLMTIPEVNIIAIIPIVIVESLIESKQIRDRGSDLHLFKI